MLPISLVAIALLCATFIQVLTPRLKNITIDDGARRLEDVPFPFLRQTSAPVKEYHITADIDYQPYQFTRFTLLPTLCLVAVEINGKPIALPSEHCDFRNGYDIHLPTGPAATVSQPMHLDAKVSNPLIDTFDVFSLSVRAPTGQPLVLMLSLIAAAALAGGLYLALRRWRFSPTVSLILVASLPIQLLYQSHTPIVERTYDVLGHLQHIEYVAYHASLPPSGYCHECFQPGLYYISAAAVYLAARATGIFDPMQVLQFLALFWFWVFLVMSARIVLLWVPQPPDVLLAVALLAFWPAGFLHSARVSNDIPLYAFSATCLYFLLKWWKTDSRKHLILAAIVAGCGVLVKTTMMPLFIALALLILYRMFSERHAGTAWSFYLVPLSLMIAGIAVYIAQSSLRGDIAPPFHDNSQAMYVGNSWKQYLVLNTASYFRAPFVDSLRDDSGRQYFWNYVLKSSMFGDYSGWFPKPVQRLLALVMAPLLLGLVVLFCIGVVRSVRRSARQSLPLLVVIAVSFLAVLALRFYNPNSGNNDFRYIYPVLIPIVLLLVVGTSNIRIGRALCFVFCGLSAAFYLTV
jgi:Dolichyl-phosphate-mannose-protein mannosyltransferase